MKKHSIRHFKRARRFAFLLAAAPLFQLSACQTGIQQVGASVINSLPATLFNITQGFLLAPIQALLAGDLSGTT